MRNSSLSGEAYTNELMSCGNPRRIQEVLRMKLEVFQFLCEELKTTGSLSHSKYVGIEAQVAMFIHAIAHSRSNREVQERFQHSGETVSRHFHAVLQALNRLVPYYIKLPNHSELPTAISSNPKFYPFFSNCIGALDGTHIAAKVPAEKAPVFRNRKGYLSQNVLACCDFDQLIFTFVLAGWEGSAHDGLVLEAAFNEAEFRVPKDKYYLGDAGYGLAPYCLTPYRGVRYLLRE
jgi:DDE superfamily endonuclease